MQAVTRPHPQRKPLAKTVARAGELMAALAVDHWGEMAKVAGLVWMPGKAG